MLEAGTGAIVGAETGVRVGAVAAREVVGVLAAVGAIVGVVGCVSPPHVHVRAVVANNSPTRAIRQLTLGVATVIAADPC